MPIFYQQDIDETTKLGIWKIDEDEDFFLKEVILQREITHPHKRLQHLAGRYLLKYLFPDFPTELIRIADTRKPFLEDEAYHFSISHCGDYAAVIVSKTERVGVDIELPSPKVGRIKHKFLNGDELNMIIPASIKTINDSFSIDNVQLTLMWCCKESVFKWWSYGSVDFSEMIKLKPFELRAEGIISSEFISPQQTTSLELHYRIFDGLCVAWVKT